jgi:hypothetical protein
VNHDFSVRISLLAHIKALEHEILLNLFQDPVLVVENVDRVAQCAFKLVLVNVALSLFLRERNIAISAT